METQALEILKGINEPVVRDATQVSVNTEPEKSSRFNAMDKAGILQAGILAMGLAARGKKGKGVKVFSGFDGASGAQTGLRKAGVKIDEYHASEIDPTAIGFTQHNYPETIQHGDIRNVSPDKIGPVDLVFMGFPCQSLSSANKNGTIGLRDITTGDILTNLKQYEGAVTAGHEVSNSAMGLFEAIKKAKRFKELNPNTRFVFENVATMRPEFRTIIDDNLKLELGLDPSFEMNTKGPTNRKRLMWTDAISRDDYIALSDRMKQVMPEDIIDQKAYHNLSAKGVKDNQTDLFKDNAGPISEDGKFEAKTNPWLKGKLSTATASDGAGKLVKNGLEYNMTKKEMNRSQGNPDDFGLDYGITDRQFAKLIGNGWDQFQFKPIFDRIAMESANKVPKSTGRLGDENALRFANATYTGYQPHSQFGTRFYHSQGSPIENYGNEIGIPKNDTPHTVSAWNNWNDVYMTALTLAETQANMPRLKAEVQPILDKIAEWKQSGRSIDEPPEFTTHELRMLEELSVPDQFANFRTGIWNANSKRRLNGYGPVNYRIDLPARDVADRAGRDQMSIRGNFREDIVSNVFEPIPSRYISPANYPNDPLLQGAKRYGLMKKYGVDTRTAAQLLELKKAGINLDNPRVYDMLNLFKRPYLPVVPDAMAWIDSKMAGPNAFDRNAIRHMNNVAFEQLKYHLPNTLTQTASSYFMRPSDWAYYADMLNVPRIKELMPAIDEYLSKQKYISIPSEIMHDALIGRDTEPVRRRLPKTTKALAQPLIDIAHEHGDTNIKVFYDNDAKDQLREVILGAMLDGQLPKTSLETAMNLARFHDGPVIETLKPRLLSLSRPSLVGDPKIVAESLLEARGYSAVEDFIDYVNGLSKYSDRIFARKQLAPVLYEMALDEFPMHGSEIARYIPVDD